MRNVKQIALAAMIVAVMGITTSAMASSVTSSNPNIWLANSGPGNSDTVELIGLGLGTATSVEFGTGNVGTNFKLLSATQISVSPPAHAKGVVDIIVKAGAGTLATLTNGFTYTTANRTLQVTVNMTLGKNASIAWNAGTDNDDTITNPQGSVTGTHGVGTFNPYVWFVRDSEFGAVGTNAQVDLSGTYSTDGEGFIYSPADSDNAHHLNVLIKSKTNSTVEVDGIASDCVPSAGAIFWANTGTVGSDTFSINGSITPNAGATITNTALTTNVVTITTAAAHGFVNGNNVFIQLNPASSVYDGIYSVTVVDATHFTYARTNADVATAAASGTATLNPGASNGSQNLLPSAPKILFSGAATTAGVGAALNLQVSTPNATAAAALVTQTTTVTLIAFAP